MLEPEVPLAPAEQNTANSATSAVPTLLPASATATHDGGQCETDASNAQSQQQQRSGDESRTHSNVAERSLGSGSERPMRRRKTRRGKTKRGRNSGAHHPYMKHAAGCTPGASRGSSSFSGSGGATARSKKPEAPYNSNRFLIEDHGDMNDEIDEELRKTDQASTSTVTRTRDSSFSMDSDGGECEFYSPADYGDEFLRKEFDTAYENLQVERLQLMSKDELVHEFLQFERKMTSRFRKQQQQKGGSGSSSGSECSSDECRKEKQLLVKELCALRQEVESMKQVRVSNANTVNKSSTDSEDSETDSSGSCSSTTSSLSEPASPEPAPDVRHMNGHARNGSVSPH